MLNHLTVSIATLLALASAHADELDRPVSLIGEPVRENIKTVLSLDNAGLDGVLQQQTGKSEGSQFIRLELSATLPTGTKSDAQVEIRSRLGSIVETIPLQQLAAQTSWWTKIVPGEAYTLIIRGVPVKGAEVRLESLVRTGRPAEILSVMPGSKPQSIMSVNSRIRDIGRAVAQLFFERQGKTYACSAFLVAPNLLVTNQHCIGDQPTCQSAVALFDRDTDRMVSGDKQRHCKNLLSSNMDSDFALLEIDQNADSSIIPLQIAGSSPSSGKNLLLIEHPGGGAKQVAQSNCTADANPVRGYGIDTDFNHTCGTWGGASGAPLLDPQTFQVVGLHHLGFTRDQPKFNRAVRVERWGSLVQHFIPALARQ